MSSHHLTRAQDPSHLRSILKNQLSGSREVQMAKRRCLIRNNETLPPLRVKYSRILQDAAVDTLGVCRDDSSSPQQYRMSLLMPDVPRKTRLSMRGASTVECSRAMPRIPTMRIAVLTRLGRLRRCLAVIISERIAADLIFYLRLHILPKKTLQGQWIKQRHGICLGAAQNILPRTPAPILSHRLIIEDMRACTMVMLIVVMLRAGLRR